MTKRQITLQESSCNIDDMDIEEAISYLIELGGKFSPNAKIEYNRMWEYDTSFSLSWQREETDEEYIRRLDQEHMAEVTGKAARKAQYERLKKEFEND